MCARDSRKAHSLISSFDEMGRGLVANSPTQLEFTEAGVPKVLFHLLFVHFRNRILLFSKKSRIKKNSLDCPKLFHFNLNNPFGASSSNFQFHPLQ
jgi:hypothetical protein